MGDVSDHDFADVGSATEGDQVKEAAERPARTARAGL